MTSRCIRKGAVLRGYQYIEVQVRPGDPEHLRYNLSTLNWPWDPYGQIKDFNSSKDDVQLTPALEIQTNVVPDEDLCEEYGLISSENEDGSYTLYALLSSDSANGEITNFRTMVAYGPDALDDIRWESVRLVWFTDVKNDSWTQSGNGYRLEEEHSNDLRL